jgi:hypothetical protein
VPSAVVLRPSILFGPEDDFFNRFAAMARVSPALPLIGGGRTRFQPDHKRTAETVTAMLTSAQTTAEALKAQLARAFWRHGCGCLRSTSLGPEAATGHNGHDEH